MSDTGGRRSADTETELTGLLAAVQEGRDASAWDLARRLTDKGTDPDAALRALSAAEPRTWLRLDTALRSWHAYTGAPRVKPPVDADALDVLVAACSNDGRVRQAALATTALRTDPRLWPILVLRSADWAAPVRNNARTVLRYALATARGGQRTSALLTAVGVALRIRGRARADAIMAMVTEAVRNDSSALLAEARRSPSPPIRRWAYRLWLDDAVALDTLVETALRETDIVCRMLCAEAAAQRALAEGDVRPLERMLASRNTRVQAEALTALVKLGRADRGRVFLTSRSALVRATAQWAVRETGSDPAELYRTAQASPAELPGLVAGLGECGDARDVERVRPYLRHERPRVRAAAVRAFHRLSGPDEELAALLTDPSPAVVRAVTRRRVTALPSERLRELLADATHPRHVRQGAFYLLKTCGAWTRVEADLLLLASDDPVLGQIARADLLAWLYRDSATVYTTPSPQTRERLHALAAQAGPRLGEDGARRLRWLLGHGRP
ncbi:hypothetical protein Acsp04_28150 [Actinomadura sp. NBRC 104425]|uniref:hypothetical protein n=1 Tax=Actinomadura sp. NBRC 104425 TaxID=3032204 RepID=UPI0024A231F5|nr:hypothetical protein [Actinomadura sp. NBRC 104425]GLZ12580.1 hypothetical protein Acsp04_28150 [Actinomadura sp. NBRC 104425]